MVDNCGPGLSKKANVHAWLLPAKSWTWTGINDKQQVDCTNKFELCEEPNTKLS